MYISNPKDLDQLIASLQYMREVHGNVPVVIKTTTPGPHPVGVYGTHLTPDGKLSNRTCNAVRLGD